MCYDMMVLFSVVWSHSLLSTSLPSHLFPCLFFSIFSDLNMRMHCGCWWILTFEEKGL